MTSLTLYNTLTKRKEPLRALDPANITFYTCGPTVYDDAHIGNFRSFLAADLLRRWLESPLCKVINDKTGEIHDPMTDGPRTVRHVMNITDVGHMTDDEAADGGGDDKMQVAAKRLLEAKKAGTAHANDSAAIADPNDPRQIADFYTRRFLEDARKLGLKVALEADSDPSVMPRATDNIDGMKRMIESLADKGFAYRVDNAVYFDVQKYQQYGQLSGNTLDKLKGGAGGRVQDQHQAGKRHPADFLLWKSDPTHLMKWPGPTINNEPMPDGYPGWHIECSVMSKVLGTTLDLHSGGEDNIFPHHECERAQSCCAHDTPEFARHWFHPRFLLVEGEKMSKSKGNFFTARDLFAQGHDPAAVRLELLRSHYRSNANFTIQGLEVSQRYIDIARNRVRELECAIETGHAGAPEPESMAPNIDDDMRDFTDALNQDLNMSVVLRVLIGVSMGLHDPSARDMPETGTPRFDEITEFRELAKRQTLADRPMRAVAAKEMFETESGFKKILAAYHLIDNILGVIFTPQPKQTETDIGLFTGGLEPDPAVIDRLIARRDAKQAKDFATSDRIRDELAAMGYAIKDIPGGKVEVSRA